MAPRPVKIASIAGIKRDGTQFEGDYYVDGQWCRFQRKLPRKMGGFRQLSDNISGLARGVFSQTDNNNVFMHIGSANLLERLTVSVPSGVASAVTDRTPAGFTTSDFNLWQMDAIYDSITTNSALIAHAAPNLNDISSSLTAPIYAGPMTGTAALVALGGTSPSVSGGVVALHPYLVAYGSDGYVAWSSPDDITDWTQANGGGEAFVTAQKIVFGAAARGGATNSPSAILWSLDSVLRMSYTGVVDVVFSFDTISDESSILSSQCVIEYDGIYFWVGVDRFLMYNGVVREVPNDLNLNWFFDNLNFEQRQKVFAMKIPRWGEIWWCFPYGDATECTHAVIFNVREQTWYDTILPNVGRSSGQYPRVYQYPLMTGVTTINSILGYSSLVGGSLYTNGTYYGVPLINTTSISGSGATANITVAGNTVTTVVIVQGGSGYAIGDVLQVSPSELGGGGSGFNITVSSLSGYSLWRHEDGYDEVAGQVINPVTSYFETSDISLPAAADGQNKSLRITMIEPDFVQKGEMTVQVTGRANARSPTVAGLNMAYPFQANQPDQQVVFLKDLRREMRFKFQSNTVGGDYQMGQCIAHIEPADGTVLG
jgi:hypothetical protein